MTTKVIAECPLEVHGHVVPFSDELISGNMADAIARLESMKPLDAVRLILFSTVHGERVTDVREMKLLAEALGVFEGDDEPDEIETIMRDVKSVNEVFPHGPEYR